MDTNSVEYLKLNKWVTAHLNQGSSWDEANTLFVAPEKAEGVFDELSEAGTTPDGMVFQDWPAYVSSYRSHFTTYEGIVSDHRSNNFPVPVSPTCPWTIYRNYLLGKVDGKTRMSEASVNQVEQNCHAVLNHLSLDNAAAGATRGLVMGSVQSGKTANMIGLLTMAATYGWNMFIILTGSIDNLRIQTRNRFASDLTAVGGKSWHILDSTSSDVLMNDISAEKLITVDDLKLNPCRNGVSGLVHMDCYVFACLKNSVRLKRLITWLHMNAARASHLRLLIIDDEADQASVNTAKMSDDAWENEEAIERTKTNQLIINLVNGCDPYGTKYATPFQATNYIAFTATPYANVLNEAYKNSLYPKDYICNLPEPKEYFGPRVIFGSHENPTLYPGLDILRQIPNEEEKALKAISDGTCNLLPPELKKSICWFLSSAALLRTAHHKKPISMLVHTTSLQRGHFAEYELINSWLSDTHNRNEIVSLCESTYEYESSRFNKTHFAESYPAYPLLSSIPDTLPPFSQIKDELHCILQTVSTIKMSEDKKTDYLINGLHLCVDNCRASGRGPNGQYLRLLYPDDKQLAAMPKAPVFIVMGGGTLSRGLTLEGLSCSYFSRTSNQADSLMQMGRWFGYRRGYELLQRIWLSEATRQKFVLMAEIDEKLKDTFNQFMEQGISPGKFGPKVMSSSAIAKFNLTSKSKMQRAISASFDYSGTSYEITCFDDSAELDNNLQLTRDFLSSIQSSPKKGADASIVWTNIPSDLILRSFLNRYHYSAFESFNSDKKTFVDWMSAMNRDGKYLHWNIAIAGSKGGTPFPYPGVSVGMITRTKKKSNASCIDVGSLRSGVDAICDFDPSGADRQQIDIYKEAVRSKKDLLFARARIGLEDTPLLLLYCIDKTTGQETACRAPINTHADIISFSIIIPGEKNFGNHVTALTVDLPE